MIQDFEFDSMRRQIEALERRVSIAERETREARRDMEKVQDRFDYWCKTLVPISLSKWFTELKAWKEEYKYLRGELKAHIRKEQTNER